MKTTTQVLDAIKSAQTNTRAANKMIDSRDHSRLTEFYPVSDWGVLGFRPKDGSDVTEPKPMTEEVVRERLAEDLAFAFEKAIDKRGISSELMFEVVNMWLWILDDPLHNVTEYDDYGYSHYCDVARKYGLPIVEIGEDE